MKQQWWHDKIAYQIYPKSFYDANGDGVGDLPGVIEKLDDLKALGVDILWLSPVYRSPFVDQGYDVADYYDIDPAFGTMDDMRRLLCETKKRGMYVLMDLVVNHCSDQHEWFQRAMADPDGAYGAYFYIRDGVNGGPPNNWRSYFGGSAWTRIQGTERYYLHFFAKEQPDLNWTNPAVRRAIYDMVNWWLDQGLAGFRIDAIINVAKDLSFRSYPPDRPDGLVSPDATLAGTDAALRFLDELDRETFRKHDAFTIAELFGYDQQKLARFAGDEGCFSTIFDFDETLLGLDMRGWHAAERVTPRMYRDAVFACQRRAEGVAFLANIIENHDGARGASRYLPEESDAGKKMLGMLMALRKGLPFLYQGQELGMTNKTFSDVSEADDISTAAEYEEALAAGLSREEALAVIGRFSRDNARTPYPWSAAENAGFTCGTPWLPLNGNYCAINLEDERRDPDSVYNFYKRLIAFRKDARWRDALIYGAFEPAYTEDDEIFAFYRTGETQRLLVLTNYSGTVKRLTLDAPYRALLLNNYAGLEGDGRALQLLPYQAVVLDMPYEKARKRGCISRTTVV